MVLVSLYIFKGSLENKVEYQIIKLKQKLNENNNREENHKRNNK